MGKAPRFSIIIPALNEEKYLPKLLESLVKQTLSDFEVILVDGESKDKTVELAKEFAKSLPSLKVIISKIASLPLQRNLGTTVARADWFVFVDADTVLLPYALERSSVYIKETQTSFFSSWSRPDSEVISDALYTLFFNSTIEGGVLFKRPFAPGPFSLVKRQVFDSVKGYDESASFGEDYDFTLRVLKTGMHMDILRETLFVWSLRRVRKKGVFTITTQYLSGALNAMFFNKALKNMPGYLMGGHIYDKDQKPLGEEVLKRYEMKFKQIIRSLLE